jgi:hypothetical protein
LLRTHSTLRPASTKLRICCKACYYTQRCTLVKSPVNATYPAVTKTQHAVAPRRLPPPLLLLLLLPRLCRAAILFLLSIILIPSMAITLIIITSSHCIIGPAAVRSSCILISLTG